MGCFTGCFCQRKGKRSEQGVVKETTRSEIVDDKSLDLRVPEVAEGKRKDLVFIDKISEVFDLEDLLRASAEVLGKGSLGTSYKAVLDAGKVLVAKRLKDLIMSEKEFAEMMETVWNINHQNLIPPMAYYYSKDEKLLVYEYMPMGSLFALLHGGRSPLNWDTRIGIALGAARAIAHLHSQGPAASHGNIKSSNILLTTSFEARVSDYGLAHVSGPARASNCAPEVTNTHQISQKADVYSFGIVLLELLTRKPSFFLDEFTSEKVNLSRWILSVVDNELTSEVFELDLLQYENVEEDLVFLLQVAINCISQDPHSRPSMAEVRSQIEEICPSSFHSQLHQIQIDVEDDNSSRLPSS